MSDSQELAVIEAPAAPLALFGTNDPVQVIATAAKVATALAEVVNERKLYAIVNGKKFPTVEAWTLLGSMLGVFPITEWSRPLLNEDGSVRGYEARVVARTLSGRIVGAGEAMCVRGESKTWHSSAQEFAVRSMAQTRATSKALRGPLDFVFKLAGFQPTPAEEMSESAAPSMATVGAAFALIDQDGVIANPSVASREAVQSNTLGVEAAPSLGGLTPTAAVATPPAPSVNQGRSVGPSGPRAKRGNVVTAPQGTSRVGTAVPVVGADAPTSKEPTAPDTATLPVAPVTRPPLQETVAGTLQEIRAKIDKRKPGGGEEAFLATLRQQARESAAVLRQLRVRLENVSNEVTTPLPPATPNSDSDASLDAYITDAYGKDRTLATLNEAELAAMLGKFEELTKRVEAKLKS